ncbi:MAG: hypothetical protein FWF80_07935 [Defluviitaleaceae bacterium]|nr:hypothetical protein [Defluviitaleaceae bacterium]
MPIVKAAGKLIINAPKILAAVQMFRNTFLPEVQDIIDRIRGVQTGPLEQFWAASQNVDSQMFQERMNALHADVVHLKSLLQEYETLLEQSARGFQDVQEMNLSAVGGLVSPRGN